MPPVLLVIFLMLDYPENFVHLNLAPPVELKFMYFFATDSFWDKITQLY